MIEPNKAAPRPVYVYDLPEGVAGNDDLVKESIGLVKLTLDEELAAMKRASGDAGRMAHYLAQAALVEVDGRVLRKDTAEDESVMTRTDPVVRQLILSAYSDLSVAREDAEKKFLSSRRVRVGPAG